MIIQEDLFTPADLKLQGCIILGVISVLFEILPKDGGNQL